MPCFPHGRLGSRVSLGAKHRYCTRKKEADLRYTFQVLETTLVWALIILVDSIQFRLFLAFHSFGFWFQVGLDCFGSGFRLVFAELLGFKREVRLVTCTREMEPRGHGECQAREADSSDRTPKSALLFKSPPPPRFLKVMSTPDLSR